MELNKYILQQRQQPWNSNKNNKSLEIKPTLGESKRGNRKSQKVGVILSRLHIGHTRTAHSYLLEPKQQPTYHVYQTKYTVKYILIECTDLVHIRETFLMQMTWRSCSKILK